MGGYKFSRRIGRGGMAEVFLAMREGLAGFEKLVVVKRIFSHYCEDDRFIKMFLDEARLAASIRHPNVVEILDITRDEEGYMMVMEYLSGETLALIFETLRAQQVTIPAPIVARIGADIAAGLHYAHTATDGSGQELNIVHRDVTPSNLIVCFNGTTKIVDFGIAKAQIRDAQTRSGALKGKMAYLSPEQVEDTEVDARTDVFQLGICLHEMFTGLRLFNAEGDHQKMMAVIERPIRPPSEINPYVPKAFDDVVLRALHRDVRKRTQSADQLRRELEYALKQVGTTVSDHDVADWMQTTFGERYSERVSMERECVTQMRAGVPSSGSLPVGAGGATPTLATVVARKSSVTRTGQRRKFTAGLVAAGALVGAALGIFLFLKAAGSSDERASREVQDSNVPADAASGVEVAEVALNDAPKEDPGGEKAPVPPPAARMVPVAFETTPRDALIKLNDEPAGTGRFDRVIAVGDSPVVLTVSAACHDLYKFELIDKAPPQKIVLTRSSSPDCAEDRGPADGRVAKTQKTGTEASRKRGSKGNRRTKAGDGQSTTSPGGDTGVKSGSNSTTTDPGRKAGDKGSTPKERTSDNIDPWGKD